MADPKKQKEINVLLAQEIKLVERLRQLDAQGKITSQEAVSKLQQKNALQQKLNQLLGVTDKNLKKVAVGSGQIVDQAAETNKLFSGLAGTFKQVSKGATKFGTEIKTASSNQKAVQQFTNATGLQTDRILKAQQRSAQVQKVMPQLSGERLKGAEAMLEGIGLEMDLLSQVTGIYSDIGEEAQNLAAFQSSNSDILAESLNTSYAHQRLQEAEVFLAMNRNSLTKEGLRQAEQAVAEAREGVNVFQAQADLLDYQISQRQAMTDAILGPFQSLKSTIESFPGGTFLSKAIGLDVFEQQMNTIVQKSVQEGMANGVGAGIDKFKALTAQTKIFGISLKAAMGPLIAVGAIIGALMLFKQMSAETEELSKNTGQSALQSEKMLQSAKQMQASSGNTLANTEEIVASMTALKEEFGSTANFSNETAMNVANMSAAFGIAVGDAAAVQRQFEAMGQTSEEAFNTQALTANLSEAAGVAPGKVMKDIAKSSKAASKYLGGSAKELAKAAVTAARLGMELGDMVSIADGLLDIESSIEAEFEASVMLGRQINMDLARQLALQGDIEGATKAVLDQVGSISDFNKLGVLEKKKLAQAAGMEVGQLQDALQKQEQMNSLTAEQRKRYEEASKALEGGTLTGEDLVKQQEAALAAKEMSAQFNKIKNTLMKALYPIIKAITNIFTNILAPVLEVVGGIFKGFMFALSPVLLVFKGIAKVVSFLSPILKIIAGTIGAIYAVKALIWAGDKAALGIEKLKMMYTNKHYAKKVLITGLQKVGLISETMAGKALKANAITEKGIALTKNQQAMVDRSQLGMQIKTNLLAMKESITRKATHMWVALKNTAMKIGNALGLTGHATAVSTLATEKGKQASQVAQNVQRGLANAWETAKLTILNSQWLVEQGKTAMKAAQVAWTTIQATKEKVVMAMQSKGLLKMIGQAAMKAYQSLAAIPYVGAILGAVAAAGVIALGMSFMSDGVISPQAGGSGFGKRVLYGPEGAISFNNKDTIVAGTNLQYGNDVVSKGKKNTIMAPPGALRVNDAAINASPAGGGAQDMGPSEVELKDIKKDAARKLLKIQMIGSSPMGMLMGGLGAVAGGLGSMFGGDEEDETGSAVFDSTNAEKMDLMLGKLDALVTAVLQGQGGGGGKAGKPIQIVIGNKVIEEIADVMNVNDSYRISAGNGGEEGVG